MRSQNIKVFVLAGQSNMQGHGDLYPDNVPGTLSNFMEDGGDEAFEYVRNDDDTWATRDDVWVRYQHENGTLLSDVLSVGYGASENQIGPELGFGHQLGAFSEDQILIVKTCWGGKSLAVDFRPPSSGGQTGAYYNQMISDVATAIENIQTEFPQYTGGDIEIAGMVWFQGWNDAAEQSYLFEYEQNLINLIADVRAEWNTPDLPFVIGLTGIGGDYLREPGSWVHTLQTQIVPAQIAAANYEGHSNVAYVDTRPHWRFAEESPDEDSEHHFHNNAETYFRIGDDFGRKTMELLLRQQSGYNGISEEIEVEGYVQASTSPELPTAYNYLEYVFPEPEDQGDCLGIENATAQIEEVFMSQTHRHEISHPLYFTIGERPAILQLAVTGQGVAPDVQVEGFLDGNSLGVMCLKGPENLSNTIDFNKPNFSDYFSVTLPKAWVKPGLTLELSAGNDERLLTEDDLKISPYTEVNLVMVNMDIMDYNEEAHRYPIFDDFLEEVASALPVSVVRFGQFPETLELPVFAVANNADEPVVLQSDEQVIPNNLHQGLVNLRANYVIQAMQFATGDYPNTIYFGNTLNLAPGGWGGGGSFVSPDFTGIFIHELGHALGLPHWGDAYRVENPGPDDFSYPYSGEVGEASGRGTAWNFHQDLYEFVSPTCQNADGQPGLERSDCMQRGCYCTEMRFNGAGPWDGFSDFSIKAIHDFIVGSERQFGQVEDRGEMVDFHLKENLGYPRVTVENEKRIFSRASKDPNEFYVEDLIKLPGEEKMEQDVYLIYGSAHAVMNEANIIYEPIKYKGTLLPIIDPTDPQTFAALQASEEKDVPSMYNDGRDIVLKLIYSDGTEELALVPFSSFQRPFGDENLDNLHPGYFSLVVPGDQPLCGVEMYHRSFAISDFDYEGNIKDPSQNITAENFMDEAVLITVLDHSCNCPGTPGYIEPGTPCDDGNPMTINDVEDGFCNCEGTPVEDCGQIQNGQFASLDGWWNWGNEVANGNGGAEFEITDIDDAGIAQGNFELISNGTYAISFEAYASEAREIEVIVFQEEGVFAEYHRETIALSTEKQMFDLSFTFNGISTIFGTIEFTFSGNEASVFLDNVCFDNACGAEEIPYNGVDDDCDPTTLDDDLDQDGYDSSYDCDDNNPDINPEAFDIPDNGIDEDCDGVDATLIVDEDNDGFGSDVDCDDSDPNVNPGQTEIVYNGIDDDCDPSTLDDDLDQDGWDLINDCDDTNPEVHPFLDEIPYNGIDDDCDPSTLDDDLDQDGFVLEEDCDDENADINPDAMEIPNNGIDEDCDGMDLISSTKNLSEAKIKVYPNPVKEIVYVEIERFKVGFLRLYNLQGQLMMTTYGSNAMDLNEVTSGIYILEINSLESNQSVKKKIVVNN